MHLPMRDNESVARKAGVLARADNSRRPIYVFNEALEPLAIAKSSHP